VTAVRFEPDGEVHLDPLNMGNAVAHECAAKHGDVVAASLARILP
jgi:hypothetical protein